jgi:acyl carrier protein
MATSFTRAVPTPDWRELTIRVFAWLRAHDWGRTPKPALMPSLNSPITASELRARLLEFINGVLPSLDRRGRTWAPVSEQTPLFATDLLDSLSILHLIAAIEEFTGRPVPDQLVVMKHFQTVDAMCAAFSEPLNS